MRPFLPAIRRAGGTVVIVGTGDPVSAEAFREDLGLAGVEVLTDESGRAFALAGFRRGIWTILRPLAVANYVRAFLRGHRPSRKQGDAFQQGGVVVVSPDGSVYYRYASRASGDHPDPSDVLAAVRLASMNSPGREKISAS